MSSGSWPSQSCTDHPAAAKRSFWSVMSARLTLPSMEMLLSVPHHDQPVELLHPRQRDRLVLMPFHQAAIAGHHIGVVVDDLAPPARGQALLGDRHPDRVRQPLPSGPVVVSMPAAVAIVDPRGPRPLRMPGGPRPELAEVPRSPRSSCRCSRSGKAARKSSIDPCPADSTNRSRSGQCGAPASNFRCSETARSRRQPCPSASPGCPEFAFCTASIRQHPNGGGLHQWSGWRWRKIGDDHGGMPS